MPFSPIGLCYSSFPDRTSGPSRAHPADLGEGGGVRGVSLGGARTGVAVSS